MGRGRAKDPDPVLGAHAWAYMRRDPDYRADWALPVWEDPDAAMWRSPFWSGIPMLVGEPDPDPWPDPTALLPLLAGAGARVEGLRLMSGRLILKVELGNALLQILVPSGRMFAPGDGIMAKLGLSLPPEASVAWVEDLWRVSGGGPLLGSRGSGARTRGTAECESRSNTGPQKRSNNLTVAE